MKLTQLISVTVFIAMLAAFGLLVSGYLENEDVATKILAGRGYTDVSIVIGVDGCSSGAGYLFDAKKEAQPVKGVICMFDGTTPFVQELPAKQSN